MSKHDHFSISAIVKSANVQRRIAWGLLVLGMLFYALWLSNQAILRYTTFKATGFDLGNYDQAVWNTLHGRFFQFTNHGSNWYGYPIRLAQHVEPILLPISLLYALAPDPRTLLIFQTVALTAGALPVFVLTRRFVPSWPLLAPVMAGAYLFTPSVLGENIFDFHAVTLVTPLFLYAILALTYRRYLWFVLACLLAAACKEEVPLVVALLGLLLIWKYRLPRLGLSLFVLGVIWFAIAFLVIIPHFNIGAKESNFWYRYAALGPTPGAALVNVLLHPWILLTFYVTLDRAYYLFCLLRSTGFLALLAPEWLLPILPSLAINLLSTEQFQHSGVYHYDASIVPFVVIAAIHGARRLAISWCRWRGEHEMAEQMREVVVLCVPPHTPGEPRTLAQAVPGAAVLLTLVGRWWGWICVLGERIARRPRVRQGLNWLRTRVATWRRELVARLVDLARAVSTPRLYAACLLWIILLSALNYYIMIPRLNIFWADHQPGAREQRIEQILALIPSDAVVSAGGSLNPHLSERQYVTIFPELTVATIDGKTKAVEYIIVDLTNVSPESRARSAHFLSILNQELSSQEFRILAQADGVLLLVRNSP
jgi:uncharacterized membrane protein